MFERTCFTTNGLDTVMHMINMGCLEETPHLPSLLVLVESMTMNSTLKNANLKHDLLSLDNGDKSINCVRSIVKETFHVEFVKIPVMQHQQEEHDDSISELVELLNVNLTPFVIGNVPVNGASMVYLIQELVSQIRNGGSQFNMVSATEAMVYSL